MQHADLIRMANQIADFFEPYPHDEAVAGATDHIQKFWEPRMRAGLYEILGAGGDGLSPLALEAAHAVQRADTSAAKPR